IYSYRVSHTTSPTRRSSDLRASHFLPARGGPFFSLPVYNAARFLSSANGCNEITVSPYTTKKTKCPQKRHFVVFVGFVAFVIPRSEEHTSELQSRFDFV